MQALKRAIEICGGQRKLGEKLTPPVKQQSISDWIERGNIPPKRVRQIEAATDGQVTRHELDPELYPEES
ncbi:YdaS family helix-turn-helix protein [Endozoicomonas sp. SCSIO W0465]|uniref:transcriptional regulator n=1 Tax=Endozoicomonas sp. SCSIO W0465 TaxID=2918516 RepID=UPI002076021F|nr:YdaS family helix-turn-helix protein [Endozoicomonas sp. SCSIO W0465]USE34592.1 helix-turn-helix domain-containing protein [Endozoicomonas sp. SCSIO W0465]